MRLTNVEPPLPRPHRSAVSGVLKTTISPRSGSRVRLGDLCLKRQDEGNGHRDSHQPINDRPPWLRYAALSTIENLHGHRHCAPAAVQIHSGKVMIRRGLGDDERRWFRIDDEVGYWDGEVD